MTLDEEQRRGHEAEMLLENPLLVEAFKVIEAELKNKWAESGSSEQESRERIWLMLKLLDRVKFQVETVVQTGQLAKFTLAQKASELVGRRVYPV